MNYIIESILVGIYCCIIYVLFSLFIKNFYILLLVCGYFKHFFGSSLGIWTWYCNNGDKCKKVLSQDTYYEANTLYLIRESSYEALLFLLVGTFLQIVVKCNNKYMLFFIMGIMLHITGEYSGIHKSFCINSCDRVIN